MSLHTIEDLHNASEADVRKALSRVTILDDLAAYTKWMNDNPYELEIKFTLGHQERSLGVHPSSVCKPGVCPLQLVYECTGEVKALNVIGHDTQDTFDIGTAKHAMLQAMLHDMFGDQFKDEVSLVDKELHISSHADGLFLFPSLGFILEIKTIKEGGNYGFEKIQSKPLESNLRQMMMYMKLANVPFGLLFYWCKNNSGKKEHAVVFDQEIWDDLEGVIRPVVDHAYNNGPEVVPKVGAHCKWCKFHHGCKFGRRHSNGKSSRRAWSNPRR
jgi:hypothetical protein